MVNYYGKIILSLIESKIVIQKYGSQENVVRISDQSVYSYNIFVKNRNAYSTTICCLLSILPCESLIIR